MASWTMRYFSGLNFRVARSMAFANSKDYLFALLLWPTEFYMWIRMGHFVRAWTKFFSRTQTDYAAMGRFGNVLLVGGEQRLSLTAQAGEV